MNDQLERLWERYNRRLLTFIRGRVGDDGDAEDILQEVFIRVHRNLCCQPDQAWQKPESWIYQIARNMIVDHYRRRRETVDIPDNLAADPGSSNPELMRADLDEQDPETLLAFSLKEMVDALPEPYRQALYLTEYQGLTQKQMAGRLGISLSGSKSRVQRARKKLHDMLLSCCHFELDRRGRILDYYPICYCCNPRN